MKSDKDKRFSDLVEKFSGLCMYFFINRFGTDLETAKDLTQEAFIRLYKSLDQSSSPSSVKSWLFTVCRNLASDSYKGNRTRSSDFTKELPSAGGFENDLVMKHEIMSAFNQLPERQREIMEMKYLWDIKSTAIAEILGIPPGTVRSEMHFARKKLLEIFSRE